VHDGTRKSDGRGWAISKYSRGLRWMGWRRDLVYRSGEEEEDETGTVKRRMKRRKTDIFVIGCFFNSSKAF
jgi:hypothetical protein